MIINELQQCNELDTQLYTDKISKLEKRLHSINFNSLFTKFEKNENLDEMHEMNDQSYPTYKSKTTQTDKSEIIRIKRPLSSYLVKPTENIGAMSPSNFRSGVPGSGDLESVLKERDKEYEQELQAVNRNKKNKSIKSSILSFFHL